MLPSVFQQIRILRDDLTDTILPALPKLEFVAIDRAETMAKSLNWFLESQNHLYRFEVLENHSYRRGLTELLHLAEGSAYNERASAAEHLIHQSGPSEDEALVPLFELERKNMRLKRAVSELLSGLLIDRAPIASKAKSIGLELSRQQSERNKLLADPSSRGLDQLSNVLSIWDLG